MTKQAGNENPGQERWLGSCLMWFFWGASLSFLTIFSLVVLVLLLASVVLNVYMGWELSGLEVSISRPGLEVTHTPGAPSTEALVAIPTTTPTYVLIEPAPTESPLEAELSTLAAIATEAATSQSNSTLPPVSTPVSVLTKTPAISPTSVPVAIAIGTPAAETTTSESESANVLAPVSPGAPGASPANTPVAIAEAGQEFAPPLTSSNSYSLIPIRGERESRPAEEHGDLNLKLRDPQPIQVDQLSLIDIDGSGIDPGAPKLSDVFQPDFSNAYTIHNWDWGCNCKGELFQQDHLVLVGIATTPGEPVFIPPVPQNIHGGKFYATVLYASEDSLTFIYDNVGNVTTGYTIHYLGLQTDPNLLALFRESKGNELPGLTLDTPVGVATNELIVAVRDKGTFMDARSRQDWWD